MEEQDAVKNTPAEQAVETESAPVEQKADDTSQAPEVSEPQKKVSENVPYERFKEVNDRVKQLEDYVAKSQVQTTPDSSELENSMPELDPDSARAVDALVERKLEARKAADFARKHAEEFEKDKLLASRVASIIQENNSTGRFIDQEDALSQARKEIEARLAPQVQDAKSEGFSEGQQIAQEKQKLGAVGDTNKPSAKIDPNNLSATEYAKYYGIPRAN